MRKGHDGDCTIYAALCNKRPEDGICTCGYSHKSGEDRYSDELKAALEYHQARTNFLSNAFDERFFGATPEIRAAALERLKNACRSTFHGRFRRLIYGVRRDNPYGLALGYRYRHYGGVFGLRAGVYRMDGAA